MPSRKTSLLPSNTVKIYVSYNDTELDSKPHYFATKKEAKAFGDFDTIETDTDSGSFAGADYESERCLQQGLQAPSRRLDR